MWDTVRTYVLLQVFSRTLVLAHRRNYHFQEIIQPDALRAPEVILGYRGDTPADIWNFGCIVRDVIINFNIY